jgi:CLIP-associating protein 1/2
MDLQLLRCLFALLRLQACKDAYSGDILLQPLIRSLDEQRSVKAKVAVAEFGISALVKPPLGFGEASWCNLSLLKQWLARLVSLTTDKNPKIKEVSFAEGRFGHWM